MTRLWYALERWLHARYARFRWASLKAARRYLGEEARRQGFELPTVAGRMGFSLWRRQRTLHVFGDVTNAEYVRGLRAFRRAKRDAARVRWYPTQFVRRWF